ncbi:hypothetical protein G6F65_015188 [Rhizopus arrhizus]|nr:hypothetical protein G6F65_015188 [Rhizopus arrhizus]
MAAKVATSATTSTAPTMSRGADGARAVVEHLHVDAGRQVGTQLRQCGQHGVGGAHDVGARLPADDQAHARLPVRPRLHVGVLGTVDHLRDVAQRHRRARAVGHHQLPVVLRIEQLVVGFKGGCTLLAHQRTFGLVEAGVLGHPAQVGQGHAHRRQPLRLGLDADGRALLADDVDLGHATDLADRARQPAFGQIAQLGHRHLRRHHAEHQDRAVGRIDLAPGRQVRQVAGQAPGGGIDRRLHFLRGGIDVLFQIELQRDRGAAQCAGGGHLDDARHTGQLRFQRRGNRRRHGVGAGPGQAGIDPDGGEFGLRQRRHRQPWQCSHAEQHHSQGEQRGRHRVPDEPAGQRDTRTHGAAPPLAASTAGAAASATITPGRRRDWPSRTITSPTRSSPWTATCPFSASPTLTGRTSTLPSPSTR